MSFERLLQLASLPVPARPTAFMGFDGFIDTVGHLSHGNGQFFNSMAAMGRFLLERQENNCSLEVSRSVRKFGGNMPLCAHALASMGVPSVCLGAMGDGSVEPEFRAMSPLCSLYPVAMPGECLALEFMDSKLFLADTSGPKAMSWEGILETVGVEKLAEMAGKADLLGLFNWGELPNVQQIWEAFARDILPKLQFKAHTVVFDLSDCSGRSAESIQSAMNVMAKFKKYLYVVLSANDNELASIARALGSWEADHAVIGRAVYESGCVDMLVHHSLNYARVYSKGAIETVNGIHIENPVLVTGGGDHFNAGLCLGLLAGMGGNECAKLGNTVSRLYVSTGESPSMSDVLKELELCELQNQKEEQA